MLTLIKSLAYSIALYSFVQGVSIAATVDSPIAGTTLSGSTLTLELSAQQNNSRGFQVFVGLFPGSSEYFNTQATGMVQSPVTITGLPTDGSVVNVRVFEVSPQYEWLYETNVAYYSGSDDGDGGGTGDGGGSTDGTGTPTNITVDGEVTLTTGMTAEQMQSMLTAILLTISVALAFRMILKWMR